MDEREAEIARLRKALEDIEYAECCGCSIYGEIARAALNGETIEVEHEVGGKSRVKPR